MDEYERLDELRAKFIAELESKGPTAAPFDKGGGAELYARVIAAIKVPTELTEGGPAGSVYGKRSWKDGAQGCNSLCHCSGCLS